MNVKHKSGKIVIQTYFIKIQDKKNLTEQLAPHLRTYIYDQVLKALLKNMMFGRVMARGSIKVVLGGRPIKEKGIKGKI